ncbi:MAG: hypothetical protein WBA67_16180, partial [Jannaschia sp.]
AARFGPLALTDGAFSALPDARRWSRTSPDHVDWATLTRMVPVGWFASVFAITRHPVARAVSVFHFQQEVERSVPASADFDAWLANGLSRRTDDPFLYDNHLRPQVDFLPDEAATFPIEGGLAPLVAHLDGLAGTADGPRDIGGRNVRASRGGPPKAQPSDASLDLIAHHYAADFARVGYRIDSPLPDGIAAIAEAPAPTVAGRALRKLRGLVS